MMRFLYGLAWVLAAPLALARLAWRSRRQSGYLAKVGERFGRYAPAPPGPRIWIHAVSVGETRAAAPIVAARA
jgi:3-deoxy-D-manno-octulosonic-acid transferase